MTKYNYILEQIKEVEQKIKGLTFEEAEHLLYGFNGDGTIFDYNYKDFTGTIENKDGLPVMSESYDIYNSKGQILAVLTKSEIENML